MQRLTPKERIDSFLKLAEFRAMRWNIRHQVEWKATLGLWALMAAAIYSVKVRPPDIVLIPTLIAIVVLHATGIAHILARTRYDMDMAFYYIEYAEKLLLPSSPEPRQRPSWTEGLLTVARGKQLLMDDMPAASGQIIPTIVLALVAYFLLGK